MFAVMSTPAGPAREVGVVIAHGRGDQMTFHRNQLTTKFARRLAEKGFHVIRFDYPGVGDSTGNSRGFPLSITHHREIIRIVEELRRRGLRRFVLVGYCHGGRSALAVSEALKDVEGVVLASTPLLTVRAEKVSLRPPGKRPATMPKGSGFARRSPLRRLGARLMARARSLAGKVLGNTVDPKVRRRLRKLAKSGRPALLVYGRDDEYLREARQLISVGRTTNSFQEPFLLHDRTPGVMHGFLSVSAQDAFLDIAVDWLSRLNEQAVSSRPRSEAPG